jgi:gliding motility-associated-like protein
MNDRFGVETECSFETFELSVYNRWGQLLYRTASPDETWDGKYRNVDCPEGVYFFLLDYRISGNTRSNTSGTLTLIR